MNCELPEGWCKTKLGNILSLEYGKGLVKNKRDNKGKFLVFGSNGPVGKHSNCIVKEPCLIVGRKGAVGEIHISKNPCWPIDTTYFVIPPNGISLDFLFHLLSFLKLGKLDKSTAIPGLNRNDAYNVDIDLPPTNEQHRIVAKIEELFTKLDAGIEALKQAKAQLKQYRQSVLKAAVEGKLTEEWREQHIGELEPADKLLERILKERRKKWEAEQLSKYKSKGKKPPKNWRDKYKEPTPPNRTSLPELPEGWLWITMNSISLKITDGEHIRPKMVKKGIPFLSAKNVQDEDIIFDGKLYISHDDATKFWHRCKPERNDILIVSRGATVSRSCVIKTDKKFCLLGSVILIKPSKILLSKYVLYMLKSSAIQKAMTSLSGSTAQQAIYIRDIRNLSIPIAPLTEQKTIIEKLERILSNIKEVDLIINKELNRAKSLRQSILKCAFEGKLVPQDPNDEPASVLLERIKSEKAKSNKLNNKSKTQEKT